jgi:hypothetical protein
LENKTCSKETTGSIHFNQRKFGVPAAKPFRIRRAAGRAFLNSRMTRCRGANSNAGRKVMNESAITVVKIVVKSQEETH